MQAHYDVIVVGGGMVGAAVAAGLLQAENCASLRLAIIESQKFDFDFPAGFDPRVSAISVGSQRMLQAIGAWPLMEQQRISPYDGMYVWDADGTGAIEFAAKDMAEPVLGHIVENRVVLSSLLQKLQQFENLDFYCPKKIARLDRQAQGWNVTLNDGLELSADLLVGADGALSSVRALAGIDCSEKPYHHRAVVTTIETEEPHGAVARQRFMATGPLAFLPLLAEDGGQQYCSVVWSLDQDRAEEISALGDDQFRFALAQASEHCLGEIVSFEGRFSFPLLQRHAEKYVAPGLALVGDAAHTIHPLAGQGVNLGFMDAAVLIEEIDRGQRRGLAAGELMVLRRYERRRRGPNTLMMQSMTGFKELFAADQLPVRWLRNSGLDVSNRIAPLKSQFMLHAMGLKGDVPRLARASTL